MTAEQRQNRIITFFILLSLLLHLLLLLVPKQKLFPTEITPKPVYVEVRPPEMRDRELDLPMREELEKPRETPAKRLAEKDQVVENETAPEGKDTEDRQQQVQAPKPEPKPAPKPEPKPAPQPQPTPAPKVQPTPKQQAPTQETVQETPAPVTPEGWQQPKEETQTMKDLPDLQTLTQLSPSTLAKIESDWRRKYREDIAKGDTVWMDTQQDLLYSFMKRFRDNIYNVWNYPDAATRQGQQGTCLLRITVDRKGNVTDVTLLESSGHRLLDEEAMRAVRQGATYGPLPRAYPNEDLKIMAFFQYHLSGVTGGSFRRRIPGQIY